MMKQDVLNKFVGNDDVTTDGELQKKYSFFFFLFFFYSLHLNLGALQLLDAQRRPLLDVWRYST